MTIRKFLQIAVCVLAIPAGGAGCTQEQINEAIVAFGATAALVLIGVIISHSSGQVRELEVVSDARLKTAIKPVAVLPNGLTLYSFKFRSDPTTTYVGVLAQDLLKSDSPNFRHAVVVMPNGYYSVNYAQLGLKMFTLDEWQAVSAEVCRHAEAHCHYVRMSDLGIGSYPTLAN